MICTGGKRVNKEKMRHQAKLLREKKLARMAKVAKRLRPRVEKGVVKYDLPVPNKPKEIRNFAVPPPAKRIVRQVVPKSQQTDQQQDTKQQQINPQKIVRRRNRGCSGCRRKIGGK